MEIQVYLRKFVIFSSNVNFSWEETCYKLWNCWIIGIVYTDMIIDKSFAAIRFGRNLQDFDQ
jgi:hypothetical protein